MGHRGAGGLLHHKPLGIEQPFEGPVKLQGVELGKLRVVGVGEVQEDQVVGSGGRAGKVEGIKVEQGNLHRLRGLEPLEKSVAPLLQQDPFPFDHPLGLDQPDLGGLETALVQGHQRGVFLGEPGHHRVQVHQGDRFQTGVAQQFPYRQTIPAAQDQHPFGRLQSAQGRVDQKLMVDLFIPAGKLEVPVDKTVQPARCILGKKDVLVTAGLAQDHWVLVKPLLQKQPDRFTQPKPQPQCPGGQNPGQAQHPGSGHKSAEKKEGAQSDKNIEQPQEVRNLQQVQKPWQHKDPGQGPDEAACIVHLEDQPQVVLEAGQAQLVDPDQQGNLQADQQPHPGNQQVMDYHKKFVPVAKGVKTQAGAKAAQKPQQYLDADEPLHHLVIAQVLLQVRPQAHKKHHHPDHQGPLFGGIPQDTGGEPRKAVLITQPANPHHQHGEAQDQTQPLGGLRIQGAGVQGKSRALASNSRWACQLGIWKSQPWDWAAKKGKAPWVAAPAGPVNFSQYRGSDLLTPGPG